MYGFLSILGICDLFLVLALLALRLSILLRLTEFFHVTEEDILYNCASNF